jgi:hypothetical protein
MRIEEKASKNAQMAIPESHSIFDGNITNGAYMFSAT